MVGTMPGAPGAIATPGAPGSSSSAQAQPVPGSIVPVSQAPVPQGPQGQSWQQWVTAVSRIPGAVMLSQPVQSPYLGFEIFAVVQAQYATAANGFCLPGFVKLDEGRCGAILPKIAGPGAVVAGPRMLSQFVHGFFGQVPPELAFAPRFEAPETYRNAIAYPIAAFATVGGLGALSLLSWAGAAAVEAMRD